MSWHKAVGGMLSSTSTFAVHVEMFPFTSVTVSVTEFEPTSPQVNPDGTIAMLSTAQLSAEPLSISAATIEAFPVASN